MAVQKISKGKERKWKANEETKEYCMKTQDCNIALKDP